MVSCLADGGFFFTLACCQPNVLINCFHNYKPLPFPCAWTPSPPLVLKLSLLLNHPVGWALGWIGNLVFSNMAVLSLVGIRTNILQTSHAKKLAHSFAISKRFMQFSRILRKADVCVYYSSSTIKIMTYVTKSQSSQKQQQGNCLCTWMLRTIRTYNFCKHDLQQLFKGIW